MRRFVISCLLFALLGSIIAGCGGTKARSEDTTVYISGNIGNQPCYWRIKDGVVNRVNFNNIGIDISSVFSSICVENKNVYVGGFYWKDKTDDNSQRPCYWKNNDIPVVLADREGYIYSIFVKNGIVYSAGKCEVKVGENYEERACYWKGNSEPIPITEDAAYAYSIFVTNDTIYVAGGYYNSIYKKNLPCYWVIKGNNVSRVELLDEKSVPGNSVTSIFIYNEIVYTTGSYHEGSENKPCYWIGKKIKPLTSPNYGFSQSIYFDKDTIYNVGAYNSKPCYWKNDGVPNPLAEYDGQVEHIFVFRDKIYFAGNKTLNKIIGHVPIIYTAPYCWILDKDGKMTEVSLEKVEDNNKSYGKATGVCVVE